MLKKLSSLLLFATFTSTQAAESLADAITEGDANISFRYRFEHVDQDGVARNANASTLKTRLNYKTKKYNGFTVFVEADNVAEVFSDNFNSGAGTTPTRGQYPVVADPTGTEINQAWVSWSNDNNNVKVGRQRINLDNQRFIGGVGWRQNEQTFDALTYKTKLGKADLFLGYADDVNRIFGDEVAAGNHDSETIMANVSVPFENKSKLVFYYYDIDNEDVAAFSTSTAGLSYAMKFNTDQTPVDLRFEYAQQSDSANNPVDYDASYIRLDGGVKLNNFKLRAGMEILEGDVNAPGSSFRTPLATLHAFNGFADRFLATPEAGLEDKFVGLNWSQNAHKFGMTYHDFSAEDGGADYGTELDMVYSYKFSKNYSTLLKFADYSSDGFSVDGQKYWMMFVAKF